jgi:hypothetical protein
MFQTSKEKKISTDCLTMVIAKRLQKEKMAFNVALNLRKSFILWRAMGDSNPPPLVPEPHSNSKTDCNK